MNFDPPFSVTLITLLAIAAIAVSIFREIKGVRRLQPRWFHPVAFLLRIGGIAVLIYLLFNPSQRVTQKAESKDQNVILLDASASMNLAAKNGRTRWEQGLAFGADIAAQLETSRLITFSTGLDSETASSANGRETNLASAIQRLLVGGQQIQPHHIHIISDGRIHDRENLTRSLALAGAAEIPVTTSCIGIDSQLRNARLESVQAPPMVRPGSPVAVHIDITAEGFQADEPFRLKIVEIETDKIKAEREFFLPSTYIVDPKKSPPIQQTLVFESGLRSAQYRVELTTADEDTSEIDTNDNRFTFQVDISGTKLRVLFCEGTHAKRMIGTLGHAWNDMEMMTRAWDATGAIEYVCLTPWSQYVNSPNLAGVTFHNGEMKLDRSQNFPATKEEFHQFDVLIVSDVAQGNFSDEQMQWVVDWVQYRGGGFLMGGGNTAFDTGKYDQTPWEKIVPVDMRAYGSGRYNKWFDIEIPEAVRDHPLWAVSANPEENANILKAHPQFTGMNLVRRAKPGALVLAHTKGGDEPVIVAQQYGRGRSVAFMPDPNGGGGNFYVDWGPVDSPSINYEAGRIEMGHGEEMVFNEIVANANYGPEPTHPSPWYGQYWVNMVRWLGENSVRWQRDQLASRIVSTQAHPGKKLPVAAEVLTVSEPEELLALNVGARLEGYNSRRVRLLYDRDRREFTGELYIPPSAADTDKLNVVFDVEAKGKLYSRMESVGVHRGNPEFTHSSPDPVLLADIARATGGEVIDSPAQAVKAIQNSLEKRLELSHRSWTEPLWSQWWLWTLAGCCFGIEWTLRRMGTQPRTGSALLISLALLLTSNSYAQQTSINRTTGEWIELLGADRVRLRDEAEDHLRKTPGAFDQLAAFTESTTNEEARIRATNILRHLKSFRWELIGIRQGHTVVDQVDIMPRGLVKSQNGKTLFSRARDFIREWHPGSIEPMRVIRQTGWGIKDNDLADGFARGITVSPNGKILVSSSEQGEVITHDTKTLKEITRFSPGSIMLSAMFIPDNRRLVTGHQHGVYMWDMRGRQMVWKNTSIESARSLEFTKRRDRIIVSADGSLFSLAVSNGRTQSKTELPTQLGGLTFDEAGNRLLGFGQNGSAHIYRYDQQSRTISHQKSYGPIGKSCRGVIWGPNEKTILTTTGNPKNAMVEWDIDTGNPIWKCPPLDFGLYTPAWIARDRIAVLGEKGMLSFWRYKEDQ